VAVSAEKLRSHNAVLTGREIAITYQACAILQMHLHIIQYERWMLTKYLACLQLSYVAAKIEFVVQVVHISTIRFSKCTNNTNVCKCRTGGIQGLKAKFKAKCAGNLRFLVGRASKVLLPSCRTASMPHYSHNANALGHNTLNCWSADRKSIRSARILINIISILINNTKWN